MNSNNKVKNKRDDKYVSDERAESHKEFENAVILLGDYINASNRRLVLECEPVLDILSVRLFCKNNLKSRNESWKICGVIFVLDQHRNICCIYEQDEFDDDVEVISGDGTLSLNFRGPDDVMSMHSPDIFVNIKDYVTGEVLIKGFAQLSKTIDTAKEQNHPFEQFRTITIADNSNGCSAVVEYLVLTYGVFAHFEVKLCGSGSKDDVDKYGNFFVYGKISVDYNLYSSEKKLNSITLFEIEEDASYFERTTLDFPITLSRSEVPVPVYSSLTVRVDLWSKAKKVPIVQGSFAIDTNTRYVSVNVIVPGLNSTNAEVTVNWKQPSNQRSTPTARRRADYHSIRQNPLCDLVLPLPMVEVFSLFIGHQKDEDLRLYGMINFCGSNTLNIFERDKNDPYILSRGCNFLPLPINNDTLVPGDFSTISVDLEDVKGLVSIKGLIRIDVSSGQVERWYNRLLCSVVKGVGNRSFAALRYTVFCHAQRAKLNVRFYSESEHFTDTCIKLHGSLVVRYGEFGIRTQYEKLYHRLVIFERRKENPMEMFGNDFDLGLSRSMVAVPCNSSVIIVADLRCCSSTGFTASLRETKEFQIGTENVTIDGDEFSLLIAVKWT